LRGFVAQKLILEYGPGKALLPGDALFLEMQP